MERATNSGKSINAVLNELTTDFLTLCNYCLVSRKEVFRWGFFKCRQTVTKSHPRVSGKRFHYLYNTKMKYLIRTTISTIERAKRQKCPGRKANPCVPEVRIYPTTHNLSLTYYSFGWQTKTHMNQLIKKQVLMVLSIYSSIDHTLYGYTDEPYIIRPQGKGMSLESEYKRHLRRTRFTK